jgi:hypothetical protein
MLWKITGWIVFTWIVIWTINHPDTASADVHRVWHAFFGSAG